MTEIELPTDGLKTCSEQVKLHVKKYIYLAIATDNPGFRHILTFHCY